MSDPRETLDGYATEDFGPFPHTLELAEIAPLAFAALRAALDLHQPVDRGTGPQCAGCATHVTFTPWPCATVKAITEALEGGVGGGNTNPEPPAPESYTLVYWQFGTEKTKPGTLDELLAEARDMAEKSWAAPQRILDPDGVPIAFNPYTD